MTLTTEELLHRACNEPCPTNPHRCLHDDGHTGEHRAPDTFDSTGVVITGWATWPQD